MSLVFVQAYLMLIRFDRYVGRGDFRTLYEKVRNCPLGRKPTPYTIERICSAVDLAAIWYWKEVRCLERSAAATCLLKRHGIAAQMVLGAEQLPFRAHAWVEVAGEVVNDKPYVEEMYAVLDRC
jgi:hypothetical protein